MTHPQILIAPDSFKGTATAQEAARYLSEGVRSVLPQATIVITPMADGGEGTAATFSGEVVTLPAVDAVGRLTEASYLYDAAQSTAYIDLAAASGLPAVADALNPLHADTYGTGVLIADAQSRGATRVVLGMGGSATTDAGTGILVALGASPTDQAGFALPQGGGSLSHLDHMETGSLNIGAAGLEWILLSDVTSPALGPEGTAAVFGPQKGATPEDISLLESGIKRACELWEIDGTKPYTGAAGGVALGITWLSRLIYGDSSHVVLLPGAQTLARMHNIDSQLAEADLLITGEGAVDAQSFTGKVLGTLSQLADPHNVPIAVATGSVTGDVPHGVTTFILSKGSVRDQLTRAGQEIAEHYRDVLESQ